MQNPKDHLECQFCLGWTLSVLNCPNLNAIYGVVTTRFCDTITGQGADRGEVPPAQFLEHFVSPVVIFFTSLKEMGTSHCVASIGGVLTVGARLSDYAPHVCRRSCTSSQCRQANIVLETYRDRIVTSDTVTFHSFFVVVALFGC